MENNSSDHSRNVEEEEYLNNHTKTFTILSEKLGFSVARNFEQQVSVVTRVSGVSLLSGAESSPLEKNDVLIKFNDNLACTFASQRSMLRKLKSSTRPLRLTFACAGSNISRINRYLQSQQVVQRQSAKSASQQMKEGAAAQSSSELKSSDKMSTGNMSGRPKKRVQLMNRPFLGRNQQNQANSLNLFNSLSTILGLAMWSILLKL